MTASLETPAVGGASRTSHRVTLVVLSAGVAAFALLQSLVIPVLPTIERGLHTSDSTVTWVLTAYLLSASVFTPIIGRVGDMFGKEKLFVVALGFVALGSLLAGLADSITLMLVARVIQGVGGGVLPLAFGIVRDEFPPEKVAGAISVTAALASAAAGLGIVLAGPIVALGGYHWLFWFPLIVVSAGTVAALLFVPASPLRASGRVNWQAGLLMSGSLVALLLAVSDAPNWGWGSPSVLALLAGAVVFGFGWIMSEQRSAHPLIDMTLMRHPVMWTTNLLALLFGFGLYAMFAFVPEFVQTPRSAGYGFSASITESGLILLPMTVAMFLLGLAAGRLSRLTSAKVILFCGSLVTVIPFVLLTLLHGHVWGVVLSTGLLGAGFGLTFSAMPTLIVASVPQDQTAVANGMNANIRTIGGAIGAGVMATVVTSGSAAGHLPALSGYVHGFEMLTASAAVATAAALLVPAVRSRGERPHPELLHAELAMVPEGTLAGDGSV